MSQNKNYWTVPNLDDSVWKNQKSWSCLELRRAWGKSSKRGEGNSCSGINCTGRDWIFQADGNWSPAIKHTMSKTTRISVDMGVKELFPQLKCDFPGIHPGEKPQERSNPTRNCSVWYREFRNWNPDPPGMVFQGRTRAWCPLGTLSSAAVLLKGWSLFHFIL